MVDLPDAATREEILKVSLANNRISPDVNITRLAATLEGYSGSEERYDPAGGGGVESSLRREAA